MRRGLSEVIKKTIILIPGIFDYMWEIKPLVKIIEQQGYNCILFSFTSWGRESYFSVEKKLELAIKCHKPVGIIGFSTGGTLALGSKHNVPVLSICGPVHGTITAYLWNTPGFKELRPNSAYVAHVLDGAKHKKRVSSVFTYLDVTVFPGISGRVGITSGNYCPLHALSCFWPQTKRDVVAFLKSLQV